MSVGTVKKEDLSTELIISVSQGDFERVKKLVRLYGLSYCKCWNGGYVPLFVAIKSGQVKIAKFLLECDAKVSGGIEQLSTPIDQACEQGSAELVRLLLKKNASVNVWNEKNETPLHLAAKNGHADIVEILLENNASVTAKSNDGFTPLYLAVIAKHGDVVRVLLEHARANLTTSGNSLNQMLLYNASVSDKVNKLIVQIVLNDDAPSKTVDHLIDHGFVLRRESVEKSFLLQAIQNNYVKLIDSLLRNYGEILNAKLNISLLRVAVACGHREIAELFLKSGCDPNVKDEHGKTCLCYALDSDERKSAEIVRLLLAYGADIREAPEFSLHRAVSEGFFDVCKVLVENGVDVNAVDADEGTALEAAVVPLTVFGGKKFDRVEVNTKIKIVKLLLNRSNNAVIDKAFQTVFHFGVTELARIFVESGVDVDKYFCYHTLYNETILEVLFKSNIELKPGMLKDTVRYEKDSEATEILLKYGADVDFKLPIEPDHDPDCDEDCVCVSAILKKHLIKMEAAGLAVTQPNEDLNYQLLADFKEHCKEEVSRLKEQPIQETCSTLHDFLLHGKKPFYAKIKPLITNFNFDAFPIYKNLLVGNLEISQARLELLDSGHQTLSTLHQTSSVLNGHKRVFPLPRDVVEEIASYLSLRDLKNLVYCGKALKKQLNQGYFTL